MVSSKLVGSGTASESNTGAAELAGDATIVASARAPDATAAGTAASSAATARHSMRASMSRGPLERRPREESSELERIAGPRASPSFSADGAGEDRPKKDGPRAHARESAMHRD